MQYLPTGSWQNYEPSHFHMRDLAVCQTSGGSQRHVRRQITRLTVVFISLFVDILLWKALAGSVSPSDSLESSCVAESMLFPAPLLRLRSPLAAILKQTYDVCKLPMQMRHQPRALIGQWDQSGRIQQVRAFSRRGNTCYFHFSLRP